jgi:hypothetical protein
MPTFQGRTVDSNQVWASPDGQRKLYSVTIDVGGKQANAKTWSEQIAKAGFSGEIETYEKEGKQGIETFVKQVQKDYQKDFKKGSYQKPMDNPHTMYLSYAKDIAVAMIMGAGFDPKEYAKIIETVAEAGNTLYSNRPGATNEQAAQQATSGVAHEVTDAELNAPIDLKDINAMFPSTDEGAAW